jgi:hypothetical protein
VNGATYAFPILIRDMTLLQHGPNLLLPLLRQILISVDNVEIAIQITALQCIDKVLDDLWRDATPAKGSVFAE